MKQKYKILDTFKITVSNIVEDEIKKFVKTKESKIIYLTKN